jgi:uncharacterized protein YkwD
MFSLVYLLLILPVLLGFNLTPILQLDQFEQEIVESQEQASSGQKVVVESEEKEVMGSVQKVRPSQVKVKIEAEAGQNYVVEALGDGFYQMNNAPEEQMATVEELNIAVNEFRKAQSRNQLEIDFNLCEFAKFRALEIADDFSHAGFSRYIESGKTDDFGFRRYGENIWSGPMMGVHIVEYGWAKSPGHYQALVGDWTKGCAGIYDVYAVFIFAR